MRFVVCDCRIWPQSLVPAAVILILVLVASCARDDSDGLDNASSAWIEQLNRENLRKFSGNADVLVLQGLLADRKHQYVDLYATATGQGANAAIDVLITRRGHDAANALAESFAGPREVQEALEFIGMAAGYALDIDRVHHWPKGERVIVTFSWGGPNLQRPERTERAEHLLLDVGWNASLPELGFRFVGTTAVVDGAGGFILTAFNSHNTVLEASYVVDRRTLAGRLFENPEFGFEAGQPLRIRLRPEFRNGRRRVAEYTVDIRAGGGSGGEGLASLAVTLAAAAGEVILNGGFEDVFVYLQDRIKDGEEPYLALRFDDALSVASVGNIARFIRQFLIPQQVRFEPDDTQLFYSAFLPNENWRDPGRRQRASQPVEVHWSSAGDAGFSGSIVQYPFPGDDEQVPTRLSFANMDEFEAAMSNAQPWNTNALFLFVDASLAYGQVRKIYQSVRKDFPHVYVFM